MFIPLFIAIMLGLVNPSTTNGNCSPNSGTVVNTQNSPDDDGGDNGDDDGDDTGGQTTQTPPPKP